MNRRSFSVGITTLASVPAAAHMQDLEATPQASPDHEQDRVDLRTRKLIEVLAEVSPSELLEALESAEVTESSLVEMNDGKNPTAVPWADYGDTDLYSSLGGVGITTGGTNLSSVDTEMIGAYIVYESAEIAYHELLRKLEQMGDLYNQPSHTMQVAGTNAWIVDVEDMQIAVARIGYVIPLALGSIPMEGVISHLDVVATELIG